jgi:nitronate monooxygenase
VVETRFTELVGCSVPIQQAPMGGVSSPRLVTAVADAGGVGTITALNMGAEQVAGHLDDLARATRGVVAVNFITENVDEQVVAAAAERVRLVDFFWLDPRPALVDVVHRAGALAGWQVGSTEEASAAEDVGCDVVTVQGLEAGGHIRGRTPLLPLLRAALEAVSIPVVAAGGITDGKRFAEVLAEGAAGARMGTRFVATEESGAHPFYKQAIVDAQGDCTVITDAFAVCPLCVTSPRARVLRTAANRVSEPGDDFVGTVTMSDGSIPVPRGSGMPPSAAVLGDVAAMALYAGTGVGSVTGIRPVAEVIAELMSHVDGAVRAAPDG